VAWRLRSRRRTSDVGLQLTQSSIVAQSGQVRYTGVILGGLKAAKDLARITTVAVRVHIRYAPDPSQAKDDNS
jgi:hypothetical protein